MAGNTETVSRHKIVGTLDTAGSTSAITVSGGRLFDISIDMDTNSFVGTISLERSTATGAANIQEWQVVEAYTSSVEKVGRSAVTRQYRLTVAAGPSNTAEFELAGGNRE